MCDTVMTLPPGRALFAKSSDRPVAEVQVVEAHAHRPAGGTVATQYLTLPETGAAATVGSRPTWLWGFEHGVNEHRVAIGNERVWTVRDAEATTPPTPALIGMDLVRLGLERGRTATEALEVMAALLEAHGQGGIADATDHEGYHSSFLLADPSGGWVLETCGSTWAARPVGRHGAGPAGASISNRLSLADDWTRASADLAPGDTVQALRHPDFPTGHADRRLAVTGALCADPVADDPGRLVATLRHHGGRPWGDPGGRPANQAGDVDPLPPARMQLDGTGVSVCMHLRGWQATAASMVLVLPEGDDEAPWGWASLGSPCTSVLVPFAPPDARTGQAAQVPEVLSDAGVWEGFRRLSLAVEDADATGGPAAGAELLAAVRRVLAPVEAELWSATDEAAAAGGGAARATAWAALAAKATPAVLGALAGALDVVGAAGT